MTEQLGLPLADIPHLKDSTVKVLRMLQAAGPRGVTSGEFADAYVVRYAARLHELKRAGYSWVKQPVPDSAQWRYRLAPWAVDAARELLASRPAPKRRREAA